MVIPRLSSLLTIKTKLAGYAGFSILSMLLLLGLAGLYFQEITRTFNQRQLVSEAVAKVQDVRLAEKTCLQFWTADARTQVNALSQTVLADYLAHDSALESVKQSFTTYHAAFAQVLQAHDKFTAASSRITAPLDEALKNINLVISELGNIQTTRQMESGESLTENEREILIAAKSCSILTLQLQSLLQRFLLTGSPDYVKKFKSEIKSGSEGDLLLETLSTIAKVAKNQVISGAAKQVPVLIRDFANQADAVQKIFTEEKTVTDALEKSGTAVLTQADQAIARANEELNRTISAAIRTLLSITFGATLIFLLVAAILIRSLLRPLRQGVALAEAVRRGDLSQRMDARSSDEIGRLSSALNTMAESLQEKAADAEAIAGGDLTREVSLSSEQDTLGLALREMTHRLNGTITNVSQVSTRLHESSQQITSASQALSSGATTSAASLQQITASITEIGGQARGNADHAEQASQVSEKTKSATDKGNQEIQELLAAMNEMKESGVQISRIVKMIDDIAFQTNLLALNAAVEAARAGHHGKGFAVVAEEVRNLAGRSASAARDTSEMVENTIQKMSKGAAISNRTEATFQDIRTYATQMGGLIHEIARASREQASSVQQISQGLQQIDEVTQHNTASAEETAAAADELLHNASHLRGLMEQFVIRRASAADH